MFLFRKKKIILLLLFVLIVILGKGVYACAGNGGIGKACFYDDETPINGAKVQVNELAICGYTAANGWVYFYDIPAGTYHLNVDVDNDGVWDVENEEITVVSGETATLINWFPLPKAQVYI